MSTPPPAKPAFGKPRSDAAPPFKPPEEDSPPVAAPVQPPAGEWKPIDSAPTDPNARFRIRVSVDGKPVPGTETVVCYRPTRKRVKAKWVAGLAIIDDRLKTKLGFRPTEWAELKAEPKK